MAANSRFAVATHLLTSLALVRNSSEAAKPASSRWLAASVNTNPIVVRRILGMLREAGLVEERAGRQGGASLARAPEQITLCDVWLAVGETSLFAYNANEPNPACPVSCHMQAILAPVFDGVSQTVKQRLAEIRLADLVAKLR